MNGQIADALPRVTNEESALGNLFADWARAAAGTDVAIANSGGIRADLPAGPLTFGRLYAVTPFDNREMTVTLTGAELRRMIANNLQQRGSFMLLSGVRATAVCASGQLRVALRRDSGRPVTDTDTLRVATSDFLVEGGDGFFTPVLPLRDVKDEGRVVRDGDRRLDPAPRHDLARRRPAAPRETAVDLSGLAARRVRRSMTGAISNPPRT